MKIHAILPPYHNIPIELLGQIVRTMASPYLKRGYYPAQALIARERWTPGRAVPPLMVKRAISAGHKYIEPVRTPRRDTTNEVQTPPIAS